MSKNYDFGYTEADVKSAHNAGFWQGVFALAAGLGIIGAVIYLAGIVNIQPL